MVDDPRQWRKRVTDAGFLYLECGLSVLPIKCDGSKSPDLPEWTTFQSQRATAGHIAAWYGNEPKGIAIIGGPVSGNLEVADFDSPDAWTQWREMVFETPCADLSWRAMKFPLVSTPSGGRHIYYRTEMAPPTNTKLARWMIDGKKKTVVETRGDHGFVLAPGCPPSCHPTGRTYDLIHGDFRHIPVISMEVRDLFINAARSLNQVEEMEHVHDPRPMTASGDRPGDLYNAAADWTSLLRRHGWTLVRTRGRQGYWRRPGKQQGLSATSNWNDTDYLYVFSSNAEPFEPERGYTKFAVYALLEHNGDYQAAATELASRGYCVTKPNVQSYVSPPPMPKGTSPLTIMDARLRYYR